MVPEHEYVFIFRALIFMVVCEKGVSIRVVICLCLDFSLRE